jgi:hypothetical protein
VVVELKLAGKKLPHFLRKRGDCNGALGQDREPLASGQPVKHQPAERHRAHDTEQQEQQQNPNLDRAKQQPFHQPASRTLPKVDVFALA